MKVRVFPVSLGEEPIYSSYYALGVLIAYAKVYQQGALNEHCIFDKIQPTHPSDTPALIEKLKSYDEPLVLMFSSYIWNYHLNVEFAREIRRHIPNVLCVFGGPQIPRAEKPLKQLMRELHCIDVAVRGEGEEIFAELLELIGSFSEGSKLQDCDFSGLSGIAYRTKELKLVYTDARTRAKDLDAFPSPYLTGEYDHLEEMPWLSVLETNRGCPFGCSFCDWGGAILSKVKKFDMDRVFAEIDFFARRKVPSVLIIDANFGIFERDIDIAKKFIETHKSTGYPQHVHQSLSKNSPERVGKIVRILYEGGVMSDAIISLQSTDPQLLENIDRKNIKVSAYEDLIKVYHDIGMTPTTDILVGIPGQNIESLKNDLQFCFDRHLVARSFLVTVLPNAPMADEEYMKRFSITLRPDNTIISSSGFTPADFEKMKRYRVMCLFYLDENFALYVALYLQLEHNIQAMDFVFSIFDVCNSNPEQYPVLSALHEAIRGRRHMGALAFAWGEDIGPVFQKMHLLWKEIQCIIEKSYSIDLNTDEFSELVQLQMFSQPNPGRMKAGDARQFGYDFTGYFSQFDPKKMPILSSRPNDFRPLAMFRVPTIMSIPDQPGLSRTHYAFQHEGLEGKFWALKLGLAV